MLKYAIVLFVGGLLTSFAEYKLQYNLFDYIVDYVKGIEHAIARLEAKIVALKAKL